MRNAQVVCVFLYPEYELASIQSVQPLA